MDESIDMFEGELLRFNKYFGTIKPGTFDIWSSFKGASFYSRKTNVPQLGYLSHFQGCEDQ